MCLKPLLGWNTENLSFRNKKLLATIQQKHAPNEAQSLCANNNAASAFMTGVANTRTLALSGDSDLQATRRGEKNAEPIF